MQSHYPINEYNEEILKAGSNWQAAIDQGGILLVLTA